VPLGIVIAGILTVLKTHRAVNVKDSVQARPPEDFSKQTLKVLTEGLPGSKSAFKGLKSSVITVLVIEIV
jgi:hypothetical protein